MSLTRSQKDTNPSSWLVQVPMDKSGMWINLCFSMMHVLDIFTEMHFTKHAYKTGLTVLIVLEKLVISKFIFDKVENIHFYVFIVSSELECWEHKGRCTLFWKETIFAESIFFLIWCQFLWNLAQLESRKSSLNQFAVLWLFLMLFGNTLSFLTCCLGI